MVTPPMVYATVPRVWPSSTVVCIASGPSLTVEDVDYCRGKAHRLAVKDAIRLAPDAEVLYACGLDSSRWWDRHGKAVTVPGRLQYTLDPAAATWATVLKNTGETGLETDPSGVRTGHHSGYQAVNVAVHLGARCILLLGYDTGHSPHGDKYFYGNRDGQIQSPYGRFLQAFQTLVEPLKTAGVRVVNCSRVTALEVFPKMSLKEALA